MVLALEVMPDLIHLFPTKIKRFKHLWAKGYYCGSAGHVSQEVVRRYSMEQQGKDVFEYSSFGDTKGQTKIGVFTKEVKWSPTNELVGIRPKKFL